MPEAQCGPRAVRKERAHATVAMLPDEGRAVKPGRPGAISQGRYLRVLRRIQGRTPAVRGSQTFSFRDADFDNPLTVPHFESRSGGTRGRPTRIRVDLEHAAQSAPHWALWFAVPAAPAGLRRAGLEA